MQNAGEAGGQLPSATDNAGGGSSVAVAREAGRPPLPPARPSAGTNPLQSYVSEPPSSLATLKAYAQELLILQAHEAGGVAEQHEAQLPADGSIAAAPRSGLSSSNGIELRQLSAGSKAAVFERLPHFQLGTQLEAAPQQPARDAGVVDAATWDAPSLRPCMRTSIGWASHSPSTTSGAAVLEHRVAGDLIMPEQRTPPAGWSGAGSPGREGGGLRRRAAPRPSQQSGAVSPSPKGAAAAAPAAAEKQTSPSKKPEPADSDKEDDMESLDFDEKQKPFYRRKQFWIIVGPLLISLVFVLAGTLYVTLGKSETLSKFEVWRLCYFIAGLPVIWWIGRGSMEFAVWAVEKTMFTWQGVLYIIYAVRRPMANLIRAALTTGWWALMMTGFSSQMDGTLKTWYNNVLKVLGCLTLFMTANLLKVLFAKMMARKFNQHSHYAKMHQALKREYLLHTLLQPRQNYAELEDLEGEELGDDEGEEDEGGMERVHSAPGELQHKMAKQTSLQRLFRKSGLFGARRSTPQLEATRQGSRSLKDRVMFWRSSTDNLHTIDEGGEAEEGAARGADEGSKDCDIEGAQLPADAVALDISVDGSVRQATPASPLLGQSPPSASLALASPAPAAPAPAVGRTLTAHSAHTTPHASPPPASKLLRHRSDAMEALGLLPPAQQSPRAPSQRGPPSGSQTPLRRRGEDSTQASMLLGFDATVGGQLPPVRVSRGPGGGSGSLGGLSREPSLAAGRAAGRLPRAPGPAGDIRRSASMQSHLSTRSAQLQAQQAQQGPTNAAAAKRTLARSPSSSSSSVRDSQKALMAIKMSKMEKYIRKHALEVTFKDALSRVERSERVTSELEAKKLGFYLYHNVRADFNRDYIVLEDLELFLNEKDAKAAMDMLDADSDGQVNVQECCAAIAKVFVERRNLAASLKDAKTIVGKLETVIGVVLHVFMGFLYLVIFNVDVLKTWAGFASLFLGFSFVFGNSIRTTYENVVFLFLVHPYDIGEVLLVDAEQYTVEEIHLSFTVLNNSSNARVWYPNEKIRLVPLINLTNSGNKGESFKVLVDIGTSAAVLEQLKAAAEGIIKANPKEFNGVCSVNLKEGGGPLKMMISVYWEFSHSGADGGRTGRNRTKMLTALSEALHRVGVRYTWPATADGRQADSHVAASSDEAAAAANTAVLL